VQVHEDEKGILSNLFQVGVNAGTKGASHYFFFIFVLTYKRGEYPSHLLSDQIQCNWGQYDSSLTIFDVKEKNSTPLHLLSPCFDEIREGACKGQISMLYDPLGSLPYSIVCVFGITLSDANIIPFTMFT